MAVGKRDSYPTRTHRYHFQLWISSQIGNERVALSGGQRRIQGQTGGRVEKEESKMEINERRGQGNRPIADLSFRNAGFRTALYTYVTVPATLYPAIAPYRTP